MLFYKINYRLIVGYLLALFFMMGCASKNIYSPYDNKRVVSLNANKNFIDLFDYEKRNFDYKSVELKRPKLLRSRKYKTDKYKDYRIYNIVFDSIGRNGQQGNKVTARYYQSQKPGKKKLIIVLPIYGSYKYPTNVIAKGVRMRSQGHAHVLVLQSEQRLLDFPALGASINKNDFDKHAYEIGERIRFSVIDIRRVVDWAERQPEIDVKRIGLVGFSMSALVASLAVIHEPRLAAGVIVMGAAHPHEVLATCDGRSGDAREQVLKRFGWTAEQYQESMQPILERLDPANFRGLAEPSKILMIDAHLDDCMPKSSRDALWSALAYPERISFKYTHKDAFLTMTPLALNYTRYKIYRFLDKVLGM